MRNNLAGMMCLDLFMSSQNEHDYTYLKSQISSSDFLKAPIKSFDFYIDYFTDEIKKINRKNDINTIKDLANKFNWCNDVDAIFKNQDFETIVLTNKAQEIIWVNDGFKKMTGFSKKYAINKTPTFLQGDNTCEETRARIRKKLIANKPFEETVLNYKKDKTAYKCEIKIFPLSIENTTHYIALEKAV